MKITRRISILVLSLTMLIGSLAIPASAAERTMYGIGFVNASSLRLRSEASTNASIAATATRGECVVVISKSGDWYKVSYNLQEGYMHKAYLDVATKVSVQLQLTDPNARSRDRVVKKSEKDGFYTALDVGCVWLERALAGK